MTTIATSGLRAGLLSAALLAALAAPSAQAADLQASLNRTRR